MKGKRVPGKCFCGLSRPRRYYRGRPEFRCKRCDPDWRSPLEARRDAILDRFGTDPASYTPRVLRRLAAAGLLDVTLPFCPAGKLSLAEAQARERALVEER